MFHYFSSSRWCHSKVDLPWGHSSNQKRTLFSSWRVPVVVGDPIKFWKFKENLYLLTFKLQGILSKYGWYQKITYLLHFNHGSLIP